MEHYAHAPFEATCQAITTYATRYPQATAILVEDKANGPVVINHLRRLVPGLIAVNPEGGKHSRASACEPRVEAGNVHLPRPTAPNGTPIPARAWVHDFIEQLAAFPMGEHDDDVDAFSQLLIRWQRPTFTKEEVDRIFSIGRGTGESWLNIVL